MKDPVYSGKKQEPPFSDDLPALEAREDELATEEQTANEEEYFLQIPPLGEVYEFGPDKRKVQVVGLDWNDYSGELTIRLRTYSPAMATKSQLESWRVGVASPPNTFSGLPALPRQNRDA